MRCLCLDLGDKRTGVAVGDTETGIASPLRVVERPLSPGDELLHEAARLAREHGAEALVVGLPLHMDGGEGARARTVRGFARRLASSTGLPVHLHDERLSTDAAHWQMAGSGLSRAEKKARRDAIAAAAILRDFFDSGAADGPPAESPPENPG